MPAHSPQSIWVTAAVDALGESATGMAGASELERDVDDALTQLATARRRL